MALKVDYRNIYLKVMQACFQYVSIIFIWDLLEITYVAYVYKL